MKWGLTRKGENDLSLDSFRNDIDRVFDNFFSFKPSSLFESEWLPRVDIEEDEKAVHVKAEIPGMSEKDLQVSLEDNLLTISGEKKEEQKKEDKNYLLSERSFGSFSRSISLPEGIKADKIKAAYKNGVLNIELPKDEKVQSKKIKIAVN